ncbi:MAG: hypothetical protein ACLPZM_03875 [Thermoplasmata archaeon]
MASALRVLGIVGAILILAGFAIVGFGLLNEAAAESTAINCTGSHCQSADQNATNASLQASSFLGIGFVSAGVGVACTLSSAVVLMGRWPPPPGPFRFPP